MADEQQVKRLLRGVSEWNQWRKEHPEILPDLNRADLSDADLRQANLRSAYLNSTDLNGANLSDADLSDADLRQANLRSAYLNSTDLNGANLSDTDLNGANLTGISFTGNAPRGHMFSFYRTNLTNTNLSRANLTKTQISMADIIASKLSGADLTAARFSYTTFARIDLNSIKGLETTVYIGPSTVDINSVILPHDEHTRNHFLRGVGWTSTQIEYLPSLLTRRPIQYHSLFISNANPDQAIAQRLYTDLRKNDVPCWFAPHDLQPGNYFRERIDQAIYTHDKVLLLLSEHSVESGWVRYEVELAIARENDQEREILYPIRLDDTIFHCTASWARSLRATRHIGDFTGWRDDVAYKQAFTTLLQHLTKV